MYTFYTNDSLNIIICKNNLGKMAALGGTRIIPGISLSNAIIMVKNLARAMTYKCAIAGVPYTGGKAIITVEKSEDVFAEYGALLESLRGGFITGEDIGVNKEDLDVISKYSHYVTRNSSAEATAEGIYASMLVCVTKKFGTTRSLADMTIMVQGVGKVGLQLVKKLSALGSKLIIVDTNEKLAFSVAEEYRASVIHPSNVLYTACDIFAPCALGGILNSQSALDITTQIICGSANDQIVESETDDVLHILQERGILYAPDFVVNAGGVLSAVRDSLQLSEWQDKNIGECITDNLQLVFSSAELYSINVVEAASRLAEDRISR